MTSIACQVMDAITAALQGTPGVATLITDSARVVEETDGMTITVDMDGAATDRIGKTCEVVTTMPVLITILSPREPGDPPNWQILDPVYVAVHTRVMADRTLGGLALDITSESRTPMADIKACALGCRYSVIYTTRQEDVSLQ